MAPTEQPVKNLDAYRLPTDVRPSHYDLTLRTDLEKETFAGAVKIDVQVVRPTNAISLNAAAELKLEPGFLYFPASADVVHPVTTTFDAGNQRITYHLADTLPAGTTATLEIAFSGLITDNMVGYYKSTWPKGIYALTQFEPTDARRALPCWDEPLLKAKFTVTMISKAGTVSLANMPVATEPATSCQLTEKLYDGVKEGTWTATKFATSPPMSTYLLAFANGEFAYLESSYTSPISGKVRPLRIYATPDVIDQAQFCLDVTTRAVPLYEEVFDVEYPLPKLDTLVARDFDAGAMENWGLITGRTSAMLLDPNSLDMQAKKRIAVTQSHEIAHMWFGDITTMAWWDNLYLNEGFATVMGESIILNKLFPDWKVDSEFINDILNDALRLDAKLSSHPIEIEVPDANQINQIFDSLSYAKAASVLRMLSEYVGEEKFLKGVSIYLKKHLFANSVSRDLWDAIAEASGVDVPKLMDPWVSKMGFPVLTVTETADGILVRQDRFLEDGPAQAEDNDTIWTVPLSLLSTTANGTTAIDTRAVLDAREKAFALDTSRPFKLNANTAGVYRVLYTPERLAAIAAEAAKAGSAFALNDRIGLVHDAMALAKAGLLDVSAALTLVDSLRDEKEFLVWSGIADNVAMVVGTWWENETVVDALNAFRRELYGPLVQRLGYAYSDTDDAATTQLRTTAISQAADAQDPEVIAALQARFQAYVGAGDASAIPADILSATLRTAVKYGDGGAYEAVYKIFEQGGTTPSLHMAAIRALGATQDPALIDRTLDTMMRKARTQDVLYFFSGLAANWKARRPLAAFFERNYDAIYKRFESTYTTKYLVSIAYSVFSTAEDRAHVEAFFEGKDISKYNMSLAQAVDTIKAKTSWIERSTPDIVQWLEKRA